MVDNGDQRGRYGLKLPSKEKPMANRRLLKAVDVLNKYIVHSFHYL